MPLFLNVIDDLPVLSVIPAKAGIHFAPVQSGPKIKMGSSFR
jgi:hypothetical protein